MKKLLIQKVALLGCLMATTLSAQARTSQVLPSLVLVQRNCVAGDIFINLKPDIRTITTNCVWRLDGLRDGKKVNEDSDMQVTLHIPANVNTVGMRCKFTPANKSDSRDQIADVAVSKDARADGSASPQQLPAGSWMKTITNAENGETEILATITNYKIDNTKEPTPYTNDPNNPYYQANVIIDLNKERNDRHFYSSNVVFNEDNELVCTFAPDTIPYTISAA